MTVLSRVGLKVVCKSMGTGPFSQTNQKVIALLFAREFARDLLDPVEYHPQLLESQEQAELSPPCATPEAQGRSHLGLIAGILV